MAATSHTTLTLLSFAQWLDHWLLSNGQYVNATTQFYPQPDPSLAGRIAFAAPFRSFVWDSGIQGATFFNGVSGYFFNASGQTSTGTDSLYSGVVFPQVGITGLSGQPLQIDFGTGAFISIVSGQGVQSGNSVFFTDSIAQTGVVRVSGSGDSSYQDIVTVIPGTPVVIPRNSWGATTDFVNGRFTVQQGIIPSDQIVSGSYSVKGFNLYFANQSQERIVFTNKYYLNSRFNRMATGIPPPRQFVTPCIFISAPLEENEPESFGGVYNTKTSISLNILAESQQQLENTISLIIDSEQHSFPQLPTSESPIGPLGDLKSDGYSYSEVSARYDQPGNLYTIQDVQASKLSDSLKIDQSIFVGLAGLEVVKPRTIH